MVTIDIFSLIGRITVQTDDAERQLDSVTGKAEKTGSRMSGIFGGVGKALGGAFVAGGLAAGSALAGVALAGTRLSSQIEQAAKDMQSQLGLTAEEAESLAGVAVNVFGNNFGQSLEEAAQGVVTVRQQIKGLADDELQSATEKAFMLSDSFGVDLTASTNAVNTLISQFGLTTDEAFDFVTSGFQRGLNASGDFLDSVGEYSTQFSNGGANAGEFFSLLESGLQGGVLGTDKAADAFKEFRLRIQDGSETTADGLALLGINTDAFIDSLTTGEMTAAQAFDTIIQKLRETEDPAARMQAGTALLGTQFEDLGDEAVAALSLTQTNLEDLAGATDGLSAKYESLPEVFGALQRKLLVMLAPIGERLLPPLHDLLAWVDRHMPEIQGFIENTFDAIGAAISFVTEKVIPPLREVFGGVAGDAEGLRGKLGPTFERIKEVLGAAFEFLVALWEETLRPAWEAIEPIVSGIFRGLAAALGPIFDGITSLLEGLTALLRGDFIGAFTHMQDAITEVWTGILAYMQEFFGGLWEAVGPTVQAFVDSVVDKIKSIPTELVGLGQDIVSGFTNGLNTAMDSAKDSITGVMEKPQQWWNGLWGRNSPARWMIDFAKDVLAGFGVGITDGSALSSLQTKVAKASEIITSAFVTAFGFDTSPSKPALWGKAIVDGIVEGVNNAAPGLTAALAHLVPQAIPIPDYSVAVPNARNVVPAGGEQYLAKDRPNEITIRVVDARGIPIPGVGATAGGVVDIPIPGVGATAGGLIDIPIPDISVEVKQKLLTPLEFLGKSLESLARDKIPLVSTVLDGLATGGPVGAVVAVFTQLLGSSQAFQNIIAGINRLLEPVINALGGLLDALSPVIDVLFALVEGALKPVIAIMEHVIAPVLSFVAKIIAGIWNALASAINWAISVITFGAVKNAVPTIDLNGDDGSIKPGETGTGGEPIVIGDDDERYPGGDTSIPNDGAGRTRPGGGNQISNITGQTRDLLISALAPLASLDSALGVLNRTYDLLDRRLPGAGFNNLAPAGFGGDMTFHIQITAPTDNPDQLGERLVRQLEEKLADRIQFLKRGRP